MKKYLLTLLAVVILIVGGLAYYKSTLLSAIDSFESCIKAGNPILESYPRQCRTSDGRSFTEVLSTHPMIRITSPQPNEIISSPVLIKGEARGPWYFEASFPVKLLNGQGGVVAIAPIQAQGEWMTEEFVPFEGFLYFATTSGGGALIFEKDNPSGLPEFDDSITIPVRFSETVSTCKPTGCSSQVCSDEDVVTTCEFKEEYGCYAKARCERQSNGSCGWTETSEFKACMSQL